MTNTRYNDAAALAKVAPKGAQMDQPEESEIDMAIRLRQSPLYLAEERLHLLEPGNLTPVEIDLLVAENREWCWRCALAFVAGVVVGFGLAVWR